MILRAQIQGRLRDHLEAEVQQVARQLRRGVTEAGREVQRDLRGQVLRAGFQGGGTGLANAWRLDVWPPNPTTPTLRPAAVVHTKAVGPIRGHEEGQPISVRGARYLCWPTGYNADRGRRNAGRRKGLKVSEAEMKAAGKESKLIPWKSKKGFLWCLRARQAQAVPKRSAKTGRTIARSNRRTRLFVGGRNIEVATGRSGRRSGGLSRRDRVEQLVAFGWVPMFFLAKQVGNRKRLDVAGTERGAQQVLAQNLITALNGR